MGFARRRPKEEASELLREARAGSVSTAQACLLAFWSHEHPSPEQVAGAGVLAHMANDLHVLARGHNLKE